jgi:hypothetical protein
VRQRAVAPCLQASKWRPRAGARLGPKRPDASWLKRASPRSDLENRLWAVFLRPFRAPNSGHTLIYQPESRLSTHKVSIHRYTLPCLQPTGKPFHGVLGAHCDGPGLPKGPADLVRGRELCRACGQLAAYRRRQRLRQDQFAAYPVWPVSGGTRSGVVAFFLTVPNFAPRPFGAALHRTRLGPQARPHRL